MNTAGGQTISTSLKYIRLYWVKIVLQWASRGVNRKNMALFLHVDSFCFLHIIAHSETQKHIMKGGLNGKLFTFSHFHSQTASYYTRYWANHREKFGFSVLLKPHQKCRLEEPGIAPPTLRLMDERCSWLRIFVGLAWLPEKICFIKHTGGKKAGEPFAKQQEKKSNWWKIKL